jgi:D-alanyl-D-alanine carboxypeptidase
MPVNEENTTPAFLPRAVSGVYSRMFSPMWVIFLLLFIGLAASVCALVYTENTLEANTVAPAAVATSTPRATFTLGMPLFSKSAYVYDMATGKVLFDRNGEMQLPLASLTKLMTALVASNKLSDTDNVAVTPEALGEDGASPFSAGEKWNFKNLLGVTLVSSSNDGAHAIAGAAGALYLLSAPQETSDSQNVSAFVGAMNDEAKKLNLTQTYFLNPTGLDETTGQSGAYGSAEDVSTLLSYIIRNKPALLEDTPEPTVALPDNSGVVASVKNTDISIGKFPGLIASKTGYTDLAGGNLAIAFDAGLAHPIIIVVLGSTEEGRFVDVETLTNATLAYLTASDAK